MLITVKRKFIKEKVPLVNFTVGYRSKVNSSVGRCESCEVSLCTKYFNIYHTCPNLVLIKKNIAMEYPICFGKGKNMGG